MNWTVLTSGIIRGVYDDVGVERYLGVPFAAPPIGKLRWQPPGVYSTGIIPGRSLCS